MANRRFMAIASLLVILAMVALTGCGGTPTPAPTAVPPTKAPAAPTAAPAAPTKAPAAPTRLRPRPRWRPRSRLPPRRPR